ncbi:hypothetical protein Q3G72_029101 [Acer saccharum]|nr:hypothetical protein Q3G72_029101 [Acer saccharum]
MNFYRAADLFHKAKTAGKSLLMVDAGTGVFGIAVLNPSTKDCSPVERYSFDLKKPDSKTHQRKAEEWRAAAQQQHTEQTQRATEQAEKNDPTCFPCFRSQFLWLLSLQ